jgi:hypothetical protein
MSLTPCPECGHDVSAAAISCPNCGRPLGTVTTRPTAAPPPPRETSSVPPWVIAAFGIGAVLLLVIIFVMFSRDSEDAANANLRIGVNMDQDRRSTTTGTAPIAPSAPAAVPESQTSVPGSQTEITAPESGRVTLSARVVSQEGTPQPVRNERFYLLDRDAETVLSEARLEPIEGNSLANSLGIATLFPDRHADFRRRATEAITKAAKFSGTTDSTGSAVLQGVEPGSYYLFSVVKTGNGFALWSSPIRVIAGENKLDLAPVRVTEYRVAG